MCTSVRLYTQYLKKKEKKKLMNEQKKERKKEPNEWAKKKKKKKERTEGEISAVFVVIFKERKKLKWKRKKEWKKERKNHVICGLPHWKRKEMKADKLLGKQTDVTTERFFHFLTSSAWLCIFWISIDSNKEERERERKWESLHFLRLYIIQPSLLTGAF